MRRRMLAVAMAITVVMTIYLSKLAWLQLAPDYPVVELTKARAKESWKQMAVIQRQRSLILDSGRGDFVDRYGRPITGETYKTAAFFPVRANVRGSEQQIAELAQLLQVSREQLVGRWDAMKTPDFWRADPKAPPLRLTDEQAERIERLDIEGVRVLPYRNRYLPRFEPKHLIGFTSEHPEWLLGNHSRELQQGKRRLTDQVGGSGLEKSLDRLLHGVGETSASFFIDGRNAPLHGLDIRINQPKNKYYPLQVVTTIDLELQNAIEAYADQVGLLEGAIVVLDAANADIVAMVSRPMLRPGQFASADGSEWTNHALKAVAPGSIYKLVTAAAALEAGVTDRHEQFECHGEYGKYGLSCWKKGGHGKLNLEEGLARSCNIVFATLAERLKAAELERVAAALGASGKIGWQSRGAFGPFTSPLRLLEEEERGRVFAADAAGTGDDGGVLAQSGIGQRDVRMTPLQAANLIVTLLHGGRVHEPRLVSEIRYANGQRMVKLPAQEAPAGNGRIQPAIAHALLRGMEAVVDHGTGRAIRQGRWAVAGKSGTAQTTRAGSARNHQWFAGYGPVKTPRYAVAVLAANRPPGSPSQAAKLFRGVMDIAADHEEGPR